jgi:DNA (cytosine-5)-methyltransferase 1
MKFIDLFAWIWWIKIWFQNAGFEWVFSNDLDKNAKITFDYNFSDLAWWKWELFHADIRDITNNQLPDFDILCWWFPCQPFSIAWYRQWFKDEWWRWNLFFEIIRILKSKKPKAFLLENVKNMKTHDWWNTMKIIYEELRNIWYHVKDIVMNTMEYWNIPQNRERVYIVWFLSSESYENFIFPEKIELTNTISDCLENWKVEDKYYYNWKPLYEKIKNDIISKKSIYQWRRKYVRENKSGVCPTLTANMWTWWHNVPIIIDEFWIRKITPRECANFQWFPKNYKLPKLADSHLYKQFWNSVSIPVIERIAKKMNLAL